MNTKNNTLVDANWLYRWGWTIKSAAEVLGVTRQHLSACLAGKRNLTPELKIKLAGLQKKPAVTANYRKDN